MIRLFSGLASRGGGRINEGQIFTIIGGPGCVDDRVWWPIRTAQDVEAWVAEADFRRYFIQPTD